MTATIAKAPKRPAKETSVRQILIEREETPTQSGCAQLVPLTEADALQLTPGEGVIHLRGGEAFWWTLDRIEDRGWGGTGSDLRCPVVFLRERKSPCGLGQGTALCKVVEVADAA